MADYDSLFIAQVLPLDGSNFVEWYLRLREVLHTNAELYVLDEPLVECPDISKVMRSTWSGLNKRPPT